MEVLMYRSHFVHDDHVVAGENLAASHEEGAIAEATKLLSERGPREGWDGFEIWSGTTLVCRG